MKYHSSNGMPVKIKKEWVSARVEGSGAATEKTEDQAKMMPKEKNLKQFGGEDGKS